jgi:hypothetical protein
VGIVPELLLGARIAVCRDQGELASILPPLDASKLSLAKNEKSMGEAKRRKAAKAAGKPWPEDAPFYGEIEMHMLPPLPKISDRVRELTNDLSIPPNMQLVLKAFRVVSGSRSFYAGFCLGDGERFSPIGIGVVERLIAETTPATPMHVVPISEQEIAWDLVLRHLRTFAGDIIVFAFSNSTVYDAGAAEMFYAPEIAVFVDGTRKKRLTTADRKAVKAKAAAVQGKPVPPIFYEHPGVDPQEQPWIFEMTAGNGKKLLITAWNGRKQFAHELPPEISHLVGGSKIAIVQVGSPVGVNGRSSIALSAALADKFDGIVHWARDTATYQSIVREFVQANLPSASPPHLPGDWNPEIVIMPVND